MEKTTSKLKPARTISREKIKDVEGKLENISSPGISSRNGFVQPTDPSDQREDPDVIVPVCQPDSEPPDESEDLEVPEQFTDKILGDITVQDFCFVFETVHNTILDNRAEAARKAREERIRQQEEAGIDIVTPENALVKCVNYMNGIKENYDLYREQKTAIAQEQAQTKETVKSLAETANRLETVIGRIEDVQGVKAPKRPPFPSWACLTYLFWHWPMYCFAYCWQSKYFRRFCFLITFLVIVVQFCMIVLLACDNKNLTHDHAKYVTVRNWSYVMKDTAAVNRFDRVDLLFEDVKFNREQIDELNEFIRSKHEKNQKRRK